MCRDRRPGSSEHAQIALSHKVTHKGMRALQSWVEMGLMAFRELLDFIDCWRLETDRAKPERIWFIDDIIPAGI